MTGTMGDYPDLSSSHIAIFGLGLMGGSLALALRDHCASVVGIDRDPAAVALARQKKAVDTASLEPTAFLSRCDLVILAVPVLAIIETLEKLPAWHKGNPVVMDLGSTKVQVVNAMEQLPARFDPIGGHPMCGKEKLSLENADPLLYYNAPFALTPLPRTPARMINGQPLPAIFPISLLRCWHALRPLKSPRWWAPVFGAQPAWRRRR